MINRISKDGFRDAFHRMGRGDQFSYDGLGYLFDYCEEIDENTELDVIALCCDYTECGNLEEFKEQYDADVDDVQDAERWLSNRTSVVHCDEYCILFAAF